MIDEQREVYASWGLGLSSAYYLLNPWTQMAQRKLASEEGIVGREVGEGGCWWVIGGAVSWSFLYISFLLGLGLKGGGVEGMRMDDLGVLVRS